MDADRKVKLIRAADSLRVAASLIEREALSLMKTEARTCECCGISRYEHFTQKNLADKIGGILQRIEDVAARFERSAATDDEALK